ncbi:unnamed protein product [Brachionus calyciflorus]|uniref:Hexosyltransferase n=1 Tax=Brachionus calyciflorus TaxID=104777 RepID=A0A813WMZ7_9BILA|nr:unnamed protein product [Brachionus calyciflorus]
MLKNSVLFGFFIGLILSLFTSISKKNLGELKLNDNKQPDYLFISILTANKYLKTRAQSSYDTWANSYQHIKFFTGSNKIESNLPIVFLPHTKDIYPPQRKSFTLLKYLYDNYLDSYEWFLRADDDVYIKIDRLLDFLRSLDSSKPYYIGQPGFGNNGNLNLNDPFCMGGPGIVISRETLRLIGPYLNYCYRNLAVTAHEDVEIGRCIKKFANISCTISYEMKSFFYQMKQDPILEYPGSQKLKKIISLHPLKSTELKYKIHSVYLRDKAIELRDQIEYLKNKISNKSDTLNPDKNYDYFDSDYLYKLDMDKPKRKIPSHLKHFAFDLNKRLNEKVLERFLTKKIEFKHGSPQFGYFKSSNSGLEFIFHNLISYRKNDDLVNLKQTIQAKLPFLEPIIRLENLDMDKKINFILPLCHKLSELNNFLINYELKQLNNVNLLIVLCSKENKKAIKLIDELKTRSLNGNIRVIQVNDEFSRGVYLRKGFELLQDDDLMFFIDVDILFDNEFLVRLRSNTIQNYQVYYPIVFSQYSPDLSLNEPNSRGEWRHYGYGMLGIYKSDFLKVNGFNESIVGWGKEDVDLYRRIVDYKKLEIFRSKEPGLVHVYHEKICDQKLAKDQYKMCIGSKIKLMASNKVLTDLFYSKFL